MITNIVINMPISITTELRVERVYALMVMPIIMTMLMCMFMVMLMIREAKKQILGYGYAHGYGIEKYTVYLVIAMLTVILTDILPPTRLRRIVRHCDAQLIFGLHKQHHQHNIKHKYQHNYKHQNNLECESK